MKMPLKCFFQFISSKSMKKFLIKNNFFFSKCYDLYWVLILRRVPEHLRTPLATPLFQIYLQLLLGLQITLIILPYKNSLINLGFYYNSHFHFTWSSVYIIKLANPSVHPLCNEQNIIFPSSSKNSTSFSPKAEQKWNWVINSVF